MKRAKLLEADRDHTYCIQNKLKNLPLWDDMQIFQIRVQIQNFEIFSHGPLINTHIYQIRV